MSEGGTTARSTAVRPAVAGDCGGIAALHAQSFPQGWDEACFAQFLADPACTSLIANSGDGLAGFIIARSAGDEADIVTLGVAPNARREGVGRLLVDTLADALRDRGVEVLFLEVGERNHAAISLYRRAGFRDAGRRPGYYAPQGEKRPEDALVLRLDLD